MSTGRPDAEPLVFETWPAFPPGVLPHDSVDLDAEDPALLDERRQCVAARADNGRCEGPAMRNWLTCAFHSGRIDPAAGGRAKAEKAREAKERAEAEMGRRSLGTRALIADVLHRQYREVEATVGMLLGKAAAGDLRAASLLVPWLNQAFGSPTEHVEHTLPSSTEEIAGASTEALAEIVRRGRERRLQAVPEQDSASTGTG